MKDRCICIGFLGGGGYESQIEMQKRVYSVEGISPTITTSWEGLKGVKIKNATKEGYLEAKEGDGIDLQYPNSRTRRGRVGKGIAPTIMTGGMGGGVVCRGGQMVIRKLTPRECWRLMDFDDSDFDKAQKVVSNMRLYEQAGNSIVVNCLVAIFGQLFDGKENVYKEEKVCR